MNGHLQAHSRRNEGKNGDGAFEHCDALTLAVEPSSYAEQYALEKEIAHMYPDSEDGLNG